MKLIGKHISYIALAIFGLSSSCCPVVGSSDFDPSPSYTFLDLAGDPIQLADNFIDSNSIHITNFSYFFDGHRPVSYSLSDSYGGNEDITLAAYSILVVSGGEFGALDEGEIRNNELILEYNYKGASYSDTIWYDSFFREDCGRVGVIDYDSFSYAGELHVATERRTDIPGFFITLREP